MKLRQQNLPELVKALLRKIGADATGAAYQQFVDRIPSPKLRIGLVRTMTIIECIKECKEEEALLNELSNTAHHDFTSEKLAVRNCIRRLHDLMLQDITETKLDIKDVQFTES